MRKTLLAASVATALAAFGLAMAQTPPASPHTVAGNLTIASDYRFRGISQTYLGPAIQGGVDYSHSSGFYIGNWNSNVSNIVFTGGSAIEMDFYGGWKTTFGDFGLDVGLLYYYYPNAEFNMNTGASGTMGSSKFDNTELYVGGSWKFLSAKLYYAVSDYFGLGDTQATEYFFHKDTMVPLVDTASGASLRGGSKGSYYLDLGVSFPVTKEFTIVAHYGMLNVKNYSELDYNDYKVGVTYDLNGWLLGASYIGTDAKKEWYYTGGSKGIKETGKNTIVVTVGKTF
jgi:uncharacterized protein (TIGR02001 family)